MDTWTISGFYEGFMCYNNDLRRFGDYFPFLVPFQKAKVKTYDDPFDRDQRFSLSARWLFQSAHAEVYFEYGLMTIHITIEIF